LCPLEPATPRQPDQTTPEWYLAAVAIPHGNDIYIASDLHLGAGFDPASSRYSRLEAFFYDNDFRNFVRAIIDRQRAANQPATLVLNGDVFDFLSLVQLPEEAELRSAGMQLTPNEREFGLSSTEEKSVWKLEAIYTGHPKFFLALAELLCEGHYLVINRGNHDAELFWPAVRRRFDDIMVRTAGREGLTDEPERLRERIQFNQWFYYEPGRFYIEHGNQYEPSNAVKYVLNPTLPPEYDIDHQPTLDYPMGSLFMRYLYNKMKLLDPFTTHYVTLEQYVGITYHHNFVDLLRTGTLNFPFFVKAMRDARVFEEQGMAPVKKEHEAKMAELAETSGLDQRLYQIEALMSRPVGTTKYNLLKQMLRPVVRGAATFLGIGLLSILIWFWIFSAIQHAPWLADGLLGRASMLAIFAVLTVVGLFLGFSFVNRALHRAGDPNVQLCFDMAQQLSSMLDVKAVSMGHTHMADHRRMTNGGTYTNTGTWIPHHGPWDSIKPMSRQFTFVTIRGDESKLHRWSNEAGRWEPVTLLEEYTPTALEKLFSEGDARLTNKEES
jgi:UDP-2,3-diacylglucosamine pyrophosphatase LpxH